jgi:hypothetical protein
LGGKPSTFHIHLKGINKLKNGKESILTVVEGFRKNSKTSTEWHLSNLPVSSDGRGTEWWVLFSGMQLGLDRCPCFRIEEHTQLRQGMGVKCTVTT